MLVSVQYFNANYASVLCHIHPAILFPFQSIGDLSGIYRDVAGIGFWIVTDLFKKFGIHDAKETKYE